MTIIIPKRSLSILPVSDEFDFFWQPVKVFQDQYASFDLFFLEKSGAGKEFLTHVDVNGWKLCEHRDYPGYPENPRYTDFIEMDGFFLCRKRKC
jgi:hypothetical protein